MFCLNRSQTCSCYELLPDAWELVLDCETFWGTMQYGDSELQAAKWKRLFSWPFCIPFLFFSRIVCLWRTFARWGKPCSSASLTWLQLKQLLCSYGAMHFEQFKNTLIQEYEHICSPCFCATSLEQSCNPSIKCSLWARFFCPKCS